MTLCSVIMWPHYTQRFTGKAKERIGSATDTLNIVRKTGNRKVARIYLLPRTCEDLAEERIGERADDG